MFKKRLATLTAVLAITSMCASSVFAAEWNTDGGEAEVEGNNYMVEAAIEVELPGDLMFGINPLRLSTDDPLVEGQSVSSQIITGQYTVVNYSNVPVVVSANTTAETADNVNLVASAGSGTEMDSANDGERDVYLVQELPVATTGVAVDSDGNITLSTNGTTNKKAASAIDSTISDTTPVAAKFRLAAFDEEDGLAATNVSGFKFGGAVDPNGAYQEGDVTLKTTYTLQTVTPAQFTTDYGVKTGAFETVAQ